MSTLVLTMRKQAPSRTAFILTSKSSGKVMPKLSASVNISRATPLHCLDILPTLSVPSGEVTFVDNKSQCSNEAVKQYTCYFITLNLTSPRHFIVQKGPFIFRTVWPSASLILNFGLNKLQSCSTEPTIVPGGDETYIF